MEGNLVYEEDSDFDKVVCGEEIDPRKGEIIITLQGYYFIVICYT